MLILNKECCFLIWEFIGNNAIFLNKELIQLLNIKREWFKIHPLTLNYKLARFKEIRTDLKKKSYIKNPRSSIVVEKDIFTVQINGNIPFGKISLSNKILPSSEMYSLLIPESKKIELGGNRYFNYRFKIYYWEIFSLFCNENDIQKATAYQWLFPAKSFQETNVLNVF